MRVWLAAALMFGFPVGAQGQSSAAENEPQVTIRDCSEHRLCAKGLQSERRRLYDNADAEVLARQQAILRRVSFTDRNTQDMVSISFVRERGRAPYVEVHTPRIDDGLAPQPLIASISEGNWQRVNDMLADFRQLPTPSRPPRDGEAIRVCADGLGAFVETVDRLGDRSGGKHEFGRPWDGALVERQGDQMCNGGAMIVYAGILADIALDQFPECQSLRNGRSSAPNLLRLCHGLLGDRLAAAEAFLFAQRHGHFESLPAGQDQHTLFASTSPDSIDRFRAEIGNRSVSLNTILGLSANDVEMTAHLIEYFSGPAARALGGDEDAGSMRATDMTIRLIRSDGVFRIHSYTTGESRLIHFEE